MTSNFKDDGDHHVGQIQVPGGDPRPIGPKVGFKVEPEGWVLAMHKIGSLTGVQTRGRSIFGPKLTALNFSNLF